MFRRAARIIGGVGTLVTALAVGPGCTEKEPLYCDPVVNSQCLEVEGSPHYCDYEQRKCRPMEAGSSAVADAGGGG